MKRFLPGTDAEAGVEVAITRRSHSRALRLARTAKSLASFRVK